MAEVYAFGGSLSRVKNYSRVKCIGWASHVKMFQYSYGFVGTEYDDVFHY
jgi:hypothetical protein